MGHDIDVSRAAEVAAQPTGFAHLRAAAGPLTSRDQLMSEYASSDTTVPTMVFKKPGVASGTPRGTVVA